MWSMAQKIKQVVEVDNKKLNIGSLTMSDASFKELPQSIRKESKVKTIQYLRNLILMGEYKGEMTKNNIPCYWFKRDEENVLVDKSSNVIVAAFTDQKEPIITPKVKTIQKSSATEKHQPKIIEVNGLRVDVTQITPSEHYLERVARRFEVTDRIRAIEFFQDIIINGEYLGLSYDKETLRKAHLFAKDNKAIFISEGFECVVTTYKQEGIIYDHPRYEIKNYIQKKIDKLRKLDSVMDKRLHRTTLEVNLEIAELELKLHRAKSQDKKFSYQGRINALRLHKNTLESERRLIATQLREYTNSLISFV
jgi:hypothetical protein